MTTKIDRDALKGPDEFVRTVSRSAEWAKTHRRPLGLAVTAVFVVLLGAGVMGWNRARRNLQASEQFRYAQTAFRAQNWEAAGEAFALLVDEYPGTAFGRLGQLYVGHAKRAAGDAIGATEAYEAFLGSNPATSEEAQLATLSLAQLREDVNDTEGALGLYGQSTVMAGPYRVEAGLSKARLESALGQRDQAAKTYEGVLPDATGTLRALIETELAALGRSP